MIENVLSEIPASHTRPGLPARMFKKLFAKWRPRGCMRLCRCCAHIFKAMQKTPVILDDFTVLVDLRNMDHQIVFLEGRYPWGAEEIGLMKAVLRKGDRVVDVGANLGVFSVLMAMLVESEGLVVAYEPEADLLKLNTAPYRQVAIRPCAVTDRLGVVRFRREPAANTYSHVEINATGKATVEIQGVRLEQDLEQKFPGAFDFIKIDVEGHEEFVIRGAEKLLKSEQAPILMFEWNPAFRDRFDIGSIKALYEIVGDEWKIYRLLDGPKLASLGHGQEPDSFCNVVAVPPDRLRLIPENLLAS